MGVVVVVIGSVGNRVRTMATLANAMFALYRFFVTGRGMMSDDVSSLYKGSIGQR